MANVASILIILSLFVFKQTAANVITKSTTYLQIFWHTTLEISNVNCTASLQNYSVQSWMCKPVFNAQHALAENSVLWRFLHFFHVCSVIRSMYVIDSMSVSSWSPYVMGF